MFENVLISEESIRSAAPVLLPLCLGLFIFVVIAFVFYAIGHRNVARVQARLQSLVTEATVEDEGETQLLKAQQVNTEFRSRMPNIRIICLFFLASGAGLFVFTEPFVMPVFGAGLFLLSAIAYWALSRKEKEEQEALTLQFPEAIDLMVRGARVGVSLEGNIKAISREVPAPLGPK